MTWSTAAEIISSILGLTSTLLLTKGDGRGWALGAVMVVFAAYVFLTSELYGSFLIQLLFLAIQLTGFWKWKTGADRDLRKICRRMTRGQLLGLATVWLLVAGGLGQMLMMNGGRLPYLDGLGTTGNVLAQLTLMGGWPECWLVYMLTNLCYIAMSYMSGLHTYLVLYSIYMFVALRGWLQWTAKDSITEKT